MGLGTAVAAGLLVAFVGLASFAAGFWIKLNQEERLLLRGFPDEYPAYRARVEGADSLCVLTREAGRVTGMSEWRAGQIGTVDLDHRQGD